jgi:hypothetical protein
VDWAKRGKKRMRIWGGKKGERLAFYLHARLHLSRATTKMLYPLYRLIHKPGTLRKIADRHLAKKVVVFNKKRGKELLLLFGKMVIGRKRPGMPWQIKLPFRLLIDETNLPQ